MDFLNKRNDRIAHADQRAERLIALGADRGVAREIAAIELGLSAGDRIELDAREGRSSDLSLLTGEVPGSAAGSTPSAKATIPNFLTTMAPEDKPRAAGHGKSSPGSPS